MSALLAWREELRLTAGDAIAFVDGATGEPVATGLRCELLPRRGGGPLGRAAITAGGLRHWPGLPDRWRRPPPAAPVLADVLVQDELLRFLPLALPWPLPAAPAGPLLGTTVLGPARVLRVRLMSAPARLAPPGFASVHGLLTWAADGAPVAWARAHLVDGAGRVHEAASDAEGRLTLHLPRPRPDRAGAPPAPAAQWQVFADPALAAPSQARGAPDAVAFAAQPEVRALAEAGADGAYAPPAFITGEPLILATGGLPPGQRELRLAPL